MKTKQPDAAPHNRVERELERERRERALNDELRTGLSTEDDFRQKDAREHTGSVHLKRPPGK